LAPTNCRTRFARCRRAAARTLAQRPGPQVVSFTPHSLPAEEALPLVAFGVEKLPDGRVLTRARFEIWPVLGAALAFAFALAGYGLLRRHWRGRARSSGSGAFARRVAVTFSP
jgi:hypothetical protein